MRAARPVEGVGWAGEARATSQRATRGGSRQSRRREFRWLEQEDQRLKKHVGRWMDIQQSLLLESGVH